MVRKSASHRTEDVLMLFTYTENPPENAIFLPAALRVSAVASACTENSSFPYTVPDGRAMSDWMRLSTPIFAWIPRPNG